MYSNRDLAKLLIPLIIEQMLTALMGTVDTVMVSTISPAAVSGVSLVDSINVLMQYVFAALATGGTIVCSQYLGRREVNGANNAARQVLLSVLVLSTVITVVCVVFRQPLLALIFGSAEPAVMDADIMDSSTWVEKSLCSSSKAKSTPARGALNAAESPAPAPQVNSKRSSVHSRRHSRDTPLPAMAPN